jgi:hypothetical protein
LQQVTHQTIENCFRKAGYVQGQSSGDSDVVLSNNDDDFRQDWEKFSGMNKDIFEDYVSVDSHVATCGVETVREPRGVRECGGGRRRRKRRWRTQSCAELAETHEALMKVNLAFMRTARVTVIVKVF